MLLFPRPGAGVELVWILNPRARLVEVYTAPDQVQRLRVGDWLAVMPRASRQP